jgi:hypothetical protein
MDEYRVLLEVRLEGPDADPFGGWRYVADGLAAKIGRMSPLDGRWTITSAEVDTAVDD